MKVGQIFNLPEDVLYPVGHIGRIKDSETQTKLIAKYEVIEVEKELKGRVIVTYGNKRKKQS